MKLKKSSLIFSVSLFLMIVSAIPLSVSMRSYLWEKKRLFTADEDLLYDRFIVGDGINTETVGRGYGGGLYAVPSLEIASYAVRKGDSLFSIAKKYNLEVDTLISVNRMRNASLLRIGTVLKIPNMNGLHYTVKRGDSLSSITARYGIDMNRLVDINDIESSKIYAGQLLFVPGARLSEWERAEALGTLFKYPTTGRLTSRMGFRTDPFTRRRAYHAGIDLANRTGTPVTSSQYGKVTFTGYKGNYGKTVVISHQQGYVTLYGHLDKIMVKKGQYVKQGQRIGTLGNTGRSTGPHLHFEIRQYRKIIDPLKILSR